MKTKKPHLWAYVNSWKRHFPTWTTRLWSDADIRPLLPAALLPPYDKVAKHAVRSDIARYLILQRHGGMYVDTDMECLANFEHVLAPAQASGQPVALFDHTAEHGPMAGILQPVVNSWCYFPQAGHPALASLLAHITEGMTRASPAVLKLPSAKWVFATTGPKAFEHALRAPDVRPPVMWLPLAMLQPVDMRNLHLDTPNADLVRARFPQAYAIHHPEGSWVGLSPNKRALLTLTKAFSKLYEASPVVSVVLLLFALLAVGAITVLAVYLSQCRNGGPRG